ncbi:hypothetical protein Y032_0332g2759 [Ancylostoma ceylanicum]|uniref:Phlebovirus glycoprotein G2 fusion domain-containing protein n=1 Tax=Ancylostoma ceylanicum TaxID=53326 RepID=A0A016S058_9BILA|nr:hypothetical protein Y032_0332g2759 [Ancylostoma ceylanicum]
MYTGNRRRHRLAISFVVIITPTQHCSDIIPLTATDEARVQNKDDNACTFSQASVVTLQPLNQEKSPLLKNNNNTIAVLA